MQSCPLSCRREALVQLTLSTPWAKTHLVGWDQRGNFSGFETARDLIDRALFACRRVLNASIQRSVTAARLSQPQRHYYAKRFAVSGSSYAVRIACRSIAEPTVIIQYIRHYVAIARNVHNTHVPGPAQPVKLRNLHLTLSDGISEAPRIKTKEQQWMR